MCSLWLVPDNEGADLMINFHRVMWSESSESSARSPARALRAAVIERINSQRTKNPDAEIDVIGFGGFGVVGL